MLHFYWRGPGPLSHFRLLCAQISPWGPISPEGLYTGPLKLPPFPATYISPVSSPQGFIKYSHFPLMLVGKQICATDHGNYAISHLSAWSFLRIYELRTDLWCAVTKSHFWSILTCWVSKAEYLNTSSCDLSWGLLWLSEYTILCLEMINSSDLHILKCFAVNLRTVFDIKSNLHAQIHILMCL